MRTSGMTEYITPRHSATESSTTPKSVMNTIVGGYFCTVSLARADCVVRNAPSKSAPRTISAWRNENLELRAGRVMRFPLDPSCFSCILYLQAAILNEACGLAPPRIPSSGYNAAAFPFPWRALMSQAIPEKYKDLFQKRAFASL